MKKLRFYRSVARRLVFLARLAGRKLFRLTATGPVRLREFFEEAGGAVLKFGQILSMRHDLLPYSYADELKSLLAQVPAAPFDAMAGVFEHETGVDIRSFFIQITQEPIASASVGQVYKAIYLESGAPVHVAVKILRPEARHAFECDFAIVRVLARCIAALPLETGVGFAEAADDFIEWSRRELDFRIEAEHAERLGRNMPEGIVTPRILVAHEAVLVSEFVHNSWPLERIIASCAADPFFAPSFQKETGISLRDVGERFIAEQMRQYFIDGFFHADPHPANMLLLYDGRLAYLDAGIAGVAGAKRAQFARSLDAISRREIREASGYFLMFAKSELFSGIEGVPEKYLKIAEKMSDAIVAKFADELSRITAPWFASMDKRSTFFLAGNRDKSSAIALTKILIASRSFQVAFPRDVVLFFRSLSIADQVALALDPSFDMIAAMRRFFGAFSPEAVEASAVPQAPQLPGKEPLEDATFDQMLELREWEAVRAIYARERAMSLALSYIERNPDMQELIAEQ